MGLIEVNDSCKWVGKQIKWQTPSSRHENGMSTYLRRGLCLEYIAPGQTLYAQSPKYGWSSSQLKAGNGHGESINPRVLVRVDRVGAKGQALKPHYYAPRLSSVIGEVEA